MLCSRFVSFCESMRKSPKLSIRLLFDLSNIANETYVDKLSLNKSIAKSNMIYANPAEHWRTPLLKSLLLIRSNQNVFDGFNYDEIAEIIDDICKNYLSFLLFSTIYINSIFYMLYILFLVDFKLYHYNCVRINRINM